MVIKNAFSYEGSSPCTRTTQLVSTSSGEVATSSAILIDAFPKWQEEINIVLNQPKVVTRFKFYSRTTSRSSTPPRRGLTKRCTRMMYFLRVPQDKNPSDMLSCDWVSRVRERPKAMKWLLFRSLTGSNETKSIKTTRWIFRFPHLRSFLSQTMVKWRRIVDWAGFAQSIDQQSVFLHLPLLPTERISCLSMANVICNTLSFETLSNLAHWGLKQDLTFISWTSSEVFAKACLIPYWTHLLKSLPWTLMEAFQWRGKRSMLTRTKKLPVAQWICRSLLHWASPWMNGQGAFPTLIVMSARSFHMLHTVLEMHLCQERSMAWLARMLLHGNKKNEFRSSLKDRIGPM